MIIDLSNYRLKEDICAVTGDGPDITPVIKPSDVIIGGKIIAEFMAHTTENEAEYNSTLSPGVQHCRYELLPEEIGLTSYYEIYQALLTAFGTTEEELLANGRSLEFPISSIKLGDDVFNATKGIVEIRSNFLNAGIVGQTFAISLGVHFINPNIVGASGGGTFVQSFQVDIIR